MHKLLPSLALLLLAVARLGAQGICDSTITIAPIQPLCESTGVRYLQVSHDGGDFSGPGITYSFSSTLKAGTLAPGLYEVTYTITGPSGCTVSDTEQFEVLDAVEAFTWANGEIDCSNPNSIAVLQAFTPGNFNEGYWEGPAGSGFSDHGNFTNTSFAGEYSFMAYPSGGSGQCPAYGTVEVAFENNPLDVNIISCSVCSSVWGTRVTLDTIPLGWPSPRFSLPVGTFDNSNCKILLEPGLLKVTLQNPENGCISEDVQLFSSVDATPSVSAGSNVGLWCGGTPNLLAATDPPDNGNGFSFFWKRPDGSTYPASWGSHLPVSEPGYYVLHGVNLFTGCEDLDTAWVAPAPPLIGSQIKVLCDGEEYLGHNQTGTYTDTLTLANGCTKVQFTKLIVLAPLLDSAIILPDNGQMTGSIEVSVTQGWPPFSYYWDNGAVTSSISNLAAGMYTVSITDANGCEHVREYEVPSNKPNRKGSSFRESPIVFQARIFPNPAPAGVATLAVDINSNQSTEATLLIHDVLGRAVAVKTVQVQEGKNTFPIAEKLSEGLYTILLQGDFGLKQVSKLVVTKP